MKQTAIPVMMEKTRTIAAKRDFWRKVGYARQNKTVDYSHNWNIIFLLR